MELGPVESIKFEVGISPRASEYVRICTDRGEERFEFDQLIAEDSSFAEALSKHAKQRPDTFHDVGNIRWTLVDIPGGQTSLQLWHLDNGNYPKPAGDMPYEYQDFEVSIDFGKMVDAYRFMLKQYLAEYDQYDFNKALTKEMVIKELAKVEKLASELG